MNKNRKTSENYLERIPFPNAELKWSWDENGNVVFNIENTGIFNRIAQRLLKKPKVSFVHLDENGSFVWSLLDGKKNIIEIGRLVDEQFGEAAHPLYERLAKFFRILDSYGFVEWR